MLGFAVFGGLAILLIGTALVGASLVSKDSVAPAVRVPAQIRSGLLGAARPGHGLDVAPGHPAYVRRSASIATRRFVSAPVHVPGVDGPAPGTVQPSTPAPAVETAPSIDGKAPPSAPGAKPDPLPGPEPAPEPPPPSPPPPVSEPPPPPPPPAEPPPPPLLAANFENGLSGWNTAGVGEALPTVTTDIVREGQRSSAIRLTGEQDRSELILGGNGGRSTAGTIQFREGDEYFYGFSFYIETMVYGGPGAHNLIMQFKSADSGSPNFGLQLWDYEGDGGQGGGRGLWSHGAAMGGDRFLAPVPERIWHDVVIRFKASSVGAGFYEVHLDGVLLDSRSGVSMIVPGAPYAYIKDGLYRNGEEIPGTSEIRLDAAKLGDSMASVMPQEHAIVEAP